MNFYFQHDVIIAVNDAALSLLGVEGGADALLGQTFSMVMGSSSFKLLPRI